MNQDYKLEIPETSKDKIEQPKISLDGVLPKISFSMLVIGPTKSGKSVLVFNIIKQFYKDAFDMVILISPTGKSDDVQAALKLPKSRVITDLKKATDALKKIIEVQQEQIDKVGYEKAKNILIYFDDVVSDYSFMNSNEVITMFIRNRHYKCSVILCSQYYKAIPRKIRMQSACNIFFNVSETELTVLAEDFEPPGLPRKAFIRTLQQVLSEPYAFITIAMFSGWNERFRKGLAQVINFGSQDSLKKKDIPYLKNNITVNDQRSISIQPKAENNPGSTSSYLDNTR